MITPELAQQLRDAGLVWRPQLHDFFMIPDTSLAERVFVIADMQAYLELYQGLPVVTFHGAVEWALDYILQQEVIWMPTEEQLRHALGERVHIFALRYNPAGYTCTIEVEERSLDFAAPNGCDAYGQALLHVLLLEHLAESGN